MIISVASGKGGTGKTTVATNLAQSLGENVSLLDCDVEEPNADLFLNPQFLKEEKITTFIPLIDETTCNSCRKCVDICMFSAIAAAGKKILVFPELCHSCEGCKVVCPEGAISNGERELGKLTSGTAGAVKFHSGRLRVGEAMSPPLIKAVRKKENESDVTIIDAPPGTSCPVISAMRNTDFVLLVTEPTPFGLNDLKLAVEALKVLGIPGGLVINRADIGDDRVWKYAKSEQLPILMEIPFERKFAEAYSEGKTIVQEYPEYKQKFLSLYDQIKQHTGPKTLLEARS